MKSGGGPMKEEGMICYLFHTALAPLAAFAIFVEADLTMMSSAKIKSVDFYRKIPRDLTEASLSGAGLSIVAALSMMFLFGMELNNYLAVSSTTSVVVDKSSDAEFLRIDFNMSFPALSCEFASVDVSDVLGTNRLNITKTIRKHSIDKHLRPTGSEFHSGSTTTALKHDEEDDEEYGEGSVSLNGHNFDRVTHHYPILVVNFFAPWCYWSNRLYAEDSDVIFHLSKTIRRLGTEVSFSVSAVVNLDCRKPSWEKAATIMRERYDLESDGRIVVAKVDCTVEVDLCRRDDHGHHDHESYYGDRDTDSLVKMMEDLIAPIKLESQMNTSDNSSTKLATGLKRPAPVTGGCRIEGFVRVKKVPGNLVISARSAAHSFDASQMNMSHVISSFSFGKTITPKVMRDIKLLLPHLGLSHDRLNGKSYITNPRDSTENVTPGSFQFIVYDVGPSHIVHAPIASTGHNGVLSFQISGIAVIAVCFQNHENGTCDDKMLIEVLHFAVLLVLIEHFIQVVKSEVMTRHYKIVEEYEYTAHSSLVHSIHVPEVKFHYEPSPMQILITENVKSFSHFLTNVCAIIGGVFTVAGILDSILHNTMRIVKKVELGKNF
ncbi:Protein disulfide-isomerase 5-4 [Capsicum annuum]|nr:Protein disulfide-isomerase 5-4 [Capsicum annuum]